MEEMLFNDANASFSTGMLVQCLFRRVESGGSPDQRTADLPPFYGPVDCNECTCDHCCSAGGTRNVAGCFLAGALVSTPDGEVAIEQLRVGDVVNSVTPEGQLVVGRVSGTYHFLWVIPGYMLRTFKLAT